MGARVLVGPRDTHNEREPVPLPSPKRFRMPHVFVLLTLVIMAIGWLTPLGPIMAVVSSAIAAAFLAWDNTDLIPARQLLPFGRRFRFLLKTLPFHLGFGLLFLVPFANILFLSFAPVGATLYYLDTPKARETLEPGASLQPDRKHDKKGIAK